MAEAVITLPDGRRAKLTGPSREAVEEKARQLAGSIGQPAIPAASGTLQRDRTGKIVGNTVDVPEPTDGPGTSFIGGIGERLADNAIGLGKAAARGGGVLGPLAPRNEGLEGMLANLPSGRDVLSGIDALPGMLSGDAGQRFKEAQENRQSSAEANPIASGLGELGGDALSILGGRAPLVRGAARGLPAASRAPSMAPGVKRAVTRVMESAPVQRLARGAGRAGQTSLEGAGLSILQDGNPVETGAYAAAGQMAGSMGLEVSKGLLSGGLGKAGMKLGAAAFATGSLLQMLKTVTPGGKNFILESLESGYDKVAFALAAGAVSGLAGAGRIGGKTAQDLPVFMDAISAIPRGVVLSLVEDATADETVAKTLDTFRDNPGAFSKSQIERLQKGLEDQKFGETVNSLLDQDDKFREILDAPDPRLAGVPKTEEEDKE